MMPVCIGFCPRGLVPRADLINGQHAAGDASRPVALQLTQLQRGILVRRARCACSRLNKRISLRLDRGRPTATRLTFGMTYQVASAALAMR